MQRRQGHQVFRNRRTDLLRHAATAGSESQGQGGPHRRSGRGGCRSPRPPCAQRRPIIAPMPNLPCHRPCQPPSATAHAASPCPTGSRRKGWLGPRRRSSAGPPDPYWRRRSCRLAAPGPPPRSHCSCLGVPWPPLWLRLLSGLLLPKALLVPALIPLPVVRLPNMPDELVDWATTHPGLPRSMANSNTGTIRVHRSGLRAVRSGFSPPSSRRRATSPPYSYIVPNLAVSCLDREWARVELPSSSGWFGC